MTYQKQWVERNDNVPGYIYLMKAEGFHGILPGCVISRVKIGLTRSVQKRLDDFHSNQPCHDLRVIKAVYVEDMAAVEGALHQQFKHCNVKLLKSREWFDLNPWDFQRCLWLMSQADSDRQSFNLSPKLITGSLVALCGVGLMVHQSFTTPTTTNQYQQASTSPHPVATHRAKHSIRHHSKSDRIPD